MLVQAKCRFYGLLSRKDSLKSLVQSAINPQSNHEWRKFIAPVPANIHSTYCKICCKTFKLSNMGRRAITSHFQGRKHVKMTLKLKNPSVDSFMKIKSVSNVSVCIFFINLFC